MNPNQEQQYRERLRTAVYSKTPVPLHLESKLGRKKSSPRRERLVWLMAVASLLVAAAFFFSPDTGQVETLLVPKDLRPGLANHIHCTLPRELAQHNGPVDEPLFVQAVADAIPEGYRVAMCHRCQFRGRPYLHLALSDGASGLISLIVTPKLPGEHLEKAAASRSLRFSVAGVETHQQLVYVVSGLEAVSNQLLLANLEPKVQKYLEIASKKM